MENKLPPRPPMPPKRPEIVRPEIVRPEVAQYVEKTNTVEPKVMENPAENVQQEEGAKTKQKFKLQSQTKALIIYLIAFLCFSGAIACFLFMFL